MPPWCEATGPYLEGEGRKDSGGQPAPSWRSRGKRKEYPAAAPSGHQHHAAASAMAWLVRMYRTGKAYVSSLVASDRTLQQVIGGGDSAKLRLPDMRWAPRVGF